MRNTKVFSIALSVAVVASSCDPSVQYRRVIQNDSSYDLKISVFGGNRPNCKYQYDNDSLIVKSKSELTFASYSGLGQTTEFNNCESCADSIVVKIVGSNALRTTINFNAPASWTFNTLRTSYKSGGTCECRLQITDNEIR